MCYDYEFDYRIRRAAEARKELKQAEERRKETATPKPAAPAEAPQPGGQEQPVPV